MSAFTNEQAKRAKSFAEEEEQRRERALIFEKNRSKRYKACSDVVRITGIEPAWIAPLDPKSSASASSAISA